MKNTIKIIVLSFLMLFCIMSFSYASSISISSDKDLTNINPGEEFNVKVKLNSDEDSVAVQCKLEFDSNKLEIIKDEAYEEMAKVDIGEDVENVTADTEGNLIINTIKGKSENNVCEFTFKVKENAKLKNDKIVLKKVDSSIELTEEEKQELNKYIENNGHNSKYTYLRQQTNDVIANGEEQNVYIIGVENQDELTNFVTMQDRKTKEKVKIQNDGYPYEGIIIKDIVHWLANKDKVS